MKKEIVLYVEDAGPAVQKRAARKRIDSQELVDKEISRIWDFLKKLIPPDMVIQTGK
ncbi:MAG: hypothetical protein LBE14_04845 [Treponema sp.]|jgi:hypothetical protein|nr:hypothetical protein [Treponema sp.]